ncbi:ATP phosphoribosyltransferase domain protein [Mycobacterium kansasii 662]|uniref:ATP phosphoribosyltransferase domain protein n=1 Tax=Mycobacterium kansasii 662 TaxID=1299326 RepID=X7YN73_MYCKA|nr:ATP phosphoribosyltransferase domain protein [Mycobacterium kansasii 662]
MISRGLSLDDVYRSREHVARGRSQQGALSEPATEILAEAAYRRRTDPKDLTVIDPANNVEFSSCGPKT